MYCNGSIVSNDNTSVIDNVKHFLNMEAVYIYACVK